MDGETVRSSSARSELRYLVLEADKEAETFRAERYRKILSELTGDRDDTAASAHRPQPASNNLLMPGGSSANRALATPTLSSYFARARLNVTVPQSQPATAVTELSASSERSCASGSTISSVMQSSSRNHGSASQGQPVQSPTCPSRGDQQVVVHAVPEHVQSRMATTSGQRSRQRILLAPSASASHGAKKSIDAAALADIFARVGLAPLVLMRDEAARARETPGISLTAFSKKIGARWKSEWGVSEMIPGYKKYLCADLAAQPYVPIAPGKPGIVIRPPTTVWTAQDDDRMFQVFSGTPSARDNLEYRGEYTTVPDIQIELDWFDIPYQCRDAWLKRFNSSSSPPAYRALRARIKLRNELKREPSTTEVLEFLRSHSNDGLLYKDISAAFRVNEEKIVIECIRCTGYSSNLARIIQRNP